MKIEWTEPALIDLETIRDYIAKDSPYYARNFIERLFDVTQNLKDYPKSGRLVPEIGDREDFRELLFQNYRIIYRLLANQVQVLAVVHGARNLAIQDKKPWN